MSNTYYDALNDFREKFIYYTKQIFKVYGYELQLMLEDYNLLSDRRNCLESSTAFGYVIEEFLVSKLAIYTRDHQISDYRICRTENSTNKLSYDCYSEITDKITALVNIKAEKTINNAIAAINQLYTDYVETKPDREKCFLVFKVHYKIGTAKDGQRKIFIDKEKYDAFYLEEIDFSKEYKQDFRNWNKNKTNLNSGRLMTSSTFRKNHKADENDISYKGTCEQLTKIYKN